MVKVNKFSENGRFQAPKRRKHYRMKVLFRLRYLRDKTHGIIYIRVTVDGNRAPERTTDIKIAREDWDNTAQRITPNHLQAQVLNARLTAIKTAFDDAYLNLQRNNETITARKLIQAVFTRRVAHPTLQDAFDWYLEEKRITSRLSPRTYEAYAKYFRNISEYFTEARQKTPLLEDINEQTLLRMLAWLKGRYAQDYAVKNAQFFRTVFTYAFAKGIVDRNPLTMIRLEKSGFYDTSHLKQDEVARLAEYNFDALSLNPETIRVLDEERDAFVFCCYTGLHHADYHQANYQVVEHNGRQWLKGYRIKSKGGRKDKPYSMPLHPLALAVIDKYGGVHQLPKRNNAKRNVVLKMIAAYVGLDVHLTTKIARKTLAHYCLNVLRMRLETVAAILGHTSTHFVKHYAEIDNLSIDSEMQFETDALPLNPTRKHGSRE